MKHEFPIELVEKELSGEASPNETEVLYSNLDLWRQHLAAIKRGVESDMVRKKADALAKGKYNHDAMTEFQQWKSRANYFKGMAETKLVQIKGLIKERNEIKSRKEKEEIASRPDKQDEIIFLLEEILEELRSRNATRP